MSVYVQDYYVDFATMDAFIIDLKRIMNKQNENWWNLERQVDSRSFGSTNEAE